MVRLTGRLAGRHAAALTDGRPLAVLATTDTRGTPHSALVSWFVLLDDRTLVAALDTRSRHVRNLRTDPRFALQVLGDDLVLALTGRADIAVAELASTPFPAAAVRLTVDHVVDQCPAHTRFRGPGYEFDPVKRHREEVERRVFAELARIRVETVRPLSARDDPA